MSGIKGKFVWYELMTGDGAAAQEFYRKVIGWDAKDAGMSDRKYTVLSAGGVPFAGILTVTEQSREVRPFWMGYVGVEDVDGFTEQVKKAGGKVHRKPEDIPNVGRFSVVADPGGAVFALFKGNSEPETSGGGTGSPCKIAWHELHAGDGEAEYRFYSGLFGWTRGEAMDMGPMGVYQMFTWGGPPIGAIMTKTPDMPASLWLFYVRVDAADAAAERIREAGGQVLFGPQEVPGGDWIVQGLDPQGAMFALVAPKR